jgi:NDP-sugar pyrophosphorylase family protein
MEPKIFLGPMSKNIVDTVIEYSNAFKLPFTFIPSRRQVDYNGGYVNNWTTKNFVEYTKKKGKYISIERDHGGPGQGTTMDNGVKSFNEDCKYMDIIHIDPWKKYQNYDDGLEETIKALNLCYNENPNLFFEIATEQGIRRFEVNELEIFILDLQKKIKPEIYKRIKYFVVQCGTGLLEATNIGNYEKERLINMTQLCKKYGFISKEHNGDWVSTDLMREKFELGLDCINVAPELGQIETKAILKQIKKIENIEKRNELFETFFQVCLKSKKWVKWVSKDFKPDENKEKLINICGHYVFSYKDFEEIKSKLPNVDRFIKRDLLKKLREYHSLYDSYYKVLIPTSGIGSRLGELTNFTNKSLIKIGDKLAICHIIEKYNKHLEFVITLGYYGQLVKDFLELAYPYHYFNFVWVDKYQGEGSSLAYSLLQAKEYLQCPFMFNCCDSLTKDEIIIPNENTLYTNCNNNTTLYASINTSNNNYVKKIHKKGEINFNYIYTGISFIRQYKEYWNVLEDLLKREQHNKELSDIDIINILLKKNKFKYVVLKQWFDSGNLTDLNINIKKMYNSSYTVLDKNDESICFLNDNVIKFFNDKDVCQNRIKRGEYLYPLTPKIIDCRDNFIKMKLIEGDLLSNVKTSGEILRLLEWSKKNLWTNNNVIDPKFPTICKKFYYTKTINRINETLKTINDCKVINESEIGPIHTLLDTVDFNNLYTKEHTNFHGDFILDNIIKTKTSYKLLDWRQNFGGELYNGDKYYDLAKLRHNIIFNHENISKKLFDLKIGYLNDGVLVDLKCNYTLMNQLNDFDNFLLKNNMDLKKTKILTALIWLNMSPLHEYPLNEFLFYFGKYNLFLELNNISDNNIIEI